MSKRVIYSDEDYKAFLESDALQGAYGRESTKNWRRKFEPFVDYERTISFNIWGLIFGVLYLAYHRAKDWKGIVVVFSLITSWLMNVFINTPSWWVVGAYFSLFWLIAMYANRWIFEGRIEEFIDYQNCMKPSWLNVFGAVIIWVAAMIAWEAFSMTLDKTISDDATVTTLENYGCDTLIAELPGQVIQNSFGAEWKILKVLSLDEIARSEDLIQCEGTILTNNGQRRTNIEADIFKEGNEVMWRVQETL